MIEIWYYLWSAFFSYYFTCFTDHWKSVRYTNLTKSQTFQVCSHQFCGTYIKMAEVWWWHGKWTDHKYSRDLICPIPDADSLWPSIHNPYVDHEQALSVPFLWSLLYAQLTTLSLSFKQQPQDRAIYQKDLRSIQYDKDNQIGITEQGIYYAYVRAVLGNGVCQFAICLGCYERNKPTCNRGFKDKTVCHSNTENHEKCCHRLFEHEGRRNL